MEPSGCAWSGNELGGSAKSFLFAFAYPVRSKAERLSCHVLWFAVVTSKSEGGALHSSFTTNNSLRFNVNIATIWQDVFSTGLIQ